ncbi:8391_t:CDS:2 [Funneliformis geosporum]|uniref:8391_t:CDS:1 n=1 Tax=Funneliformis geosporum TaxID=1117311 RepID=A0A9W4SWA2_9GLOM|nr:8391_t:CDS:2 [Funneliformis geosporum]
MGSILPISDLRLCKTIPFQKSDIYGVLPFVTSEVLRGEPYSFANDIYSFAMIMWEFISGVLPFDNQAHDFQLALDICKGKRPEIIENTPQCYINLMKRCWNMDPFKRPNTLEIITIIKRELPGGTDKDFVIT